MYYAVLCHKAQHLLVEAVTRFVFAVSAGAYTSNTECKKDALYRNVAMVWRCIAFRASRDREISQVRSRDFGDSRSSGMLRGVALKIYATCKCVRMRICVYVCVM